MSNYEGAMIESGWSGCCPVGWSWMLEGGAGEPVLCWRFRDSDAICVGSTHGEVRDHVYAGVAANLDDAMQAGSLWQRYGPGLPTAGPA